MMSLYPQLQQLSESLLQQFGSPCVVKTKNEGKYNVATGEYKKGENVSHSAYCLFDNLKYDFSQDQDAVNVQQGDVLIYITASGQPEINSLVEVNGEIWAIIRCQPIQPAGAALLYQCQGRKR